MTETKKANHQANVVKITDIRKHPNADTLDIITLGEFQVVSKTGQFSVGQYGIYIQPDSVVPQTEPFAFIWQPYVDSLVNTPTAASFTSEGDHTVPEKKRRITVRKFRGEWSEGLLMPVSDFGFQQTANGYISFLETHYFKEGDDVSDFLKITHYDPDAGKADTKGSSSAAPKLKRKYPKTVKGWYNWLFRRFYRLFHKGPLDGKEESISLGIPIYDVDALKNYPHTFEEGELVQASEKIHGSNLRAIYLDGKQYVGSRNLWKSEDSTCIFRKVLKTQPWIGEWCKNHEGYVLWGEVTPTQGGYEYGSKEPQFFVFDVRTPDGKWLDREHDEAGLLAQLQAHSVPILYQGPYDLEVIKKFVDGPSKVPGAKNIREGVVIKTQKEKHITGIGRAQMKIVSMDFLLKDNK
jgi:tRNA-binding EMAP/Myf-like protein